MNLDDLDCDKYYPLLDTFIRQSEAQYKRPNAVLLSQLEGLAINGVAE